MVAAVVMTICCAGGRPTLAGRDWATTANVRARHILLLWPISEHRSASNLDELDLDGPHAEGSA
jgi:hypothetical protein